MEPEIGGEAVSATSIHPSPAGEGTLQRDCACESARESCGRDASPLVEDGQTRSDLEEPSSLTPSSSALEGAQEEGAVGMLEAIGGQEACERLAKAFYRHVEDDPVLRPMYPKHLSCSISGLGAFIHEMLGGTTEWPLRPIFSFHLRFKIDEAKRDAWVANMRAAVEETDWAPEIKKEFHTLFAEAASQLINTGPVSESVYGSCDAEGELEQAWAGVRVHNTASEQVLKGDVEGLTHSVQYLNRHLEELLLRAAEHGHLEIMRLLVAHGAQPNKLSVTGALLIDRPEAAQLLFEMGGQLCAVGKGQPPIIGATRGDKGDKPDRVRALLDLGAPVNERGREERTALHYAARAGFLETAKLLLDHGAEINARDAKGITPLGHAKTLKKADMAAFLISRGAKG